MLEIKNLHARIAEDDTTRSFYLEPDGEGRRSRCHHGAERFRRVSTLSYILSSPQRL